MGSTAAWGNLLFPWNQVCWPASDKQNTDQYPPLQHEYWKDHIQSYNLHTDKLSRKFLLSDCIAEATEQKTDCTLADVSKTLLYTNMCRNLR